MTSFYDNEKEVSRTRYDATRENILSIYRNLSETYYYAELPIADAKINQEETRYVLRAGLILGGGYVSSQLLGYLELNKVKRLFEKPVDVRLVSVWPPTLSFWEELDKGLKQLFPLSIDPTVRYEVAEKLRSRKNQGRPIKKEYIEAHKWIIDDHKTIEEAFEEFCRLNNIVRPDKSLRNSFKAAMERLSKKESGNERST